MQINSNKPVTDPFTESFVYKTFTNKTYLRYFVPSQCELRPLEQIEGKSWVETLAGKGPMYLTEGVKRKNQAPREIASAVARFVFSVFVLQPIIAPLGIIYNVSMLAFCNLQKCLQKNDQAKLEEFELRIRQHTVALLIDTIYGYVSFFSIGLTLMVGIPATAKVIIEMAELFACTALIHMIFEKYFKSLVFLPESQLFERVLVYQKYGIVDNEENLLPYNDFAIPLLSAYARKLNDWDEERFNHIMRDYPLNDLEKQIIMLDRINGKLKEFRDELLKNQAQINPI